MIVRCPQCGRQYRLDPARLTSGRRRLRCTECGHVFAVAAKGSDATETAAAPATPGPNAAPLVVVGDEPREFRDLVCRTLEGLGCRVEATEDGESAWRIAAEKQPQLMVLNVYLRKLLGVAVCEAIKGKENLRGIRVILVGSVFKSERFVRGPRHLYGADDYFEDVIPTAEMRDRFAAMLGASRGGDRASRPGVAAGGRGGSDQRIVSGSRSVGVGAIEPRPEIRRLARIMLSDLKIYYPDRFERAVLERRFFESFREELTKGKELIAGRFPDLVDRLEVLAGALREGLDEERAAAGHVADAGR